MQPIRPILFISFWIAAGCQTPAPRLMTECDYIVANTVTGEGYAPSGEFDPSADAPPTVHDPSRPENWRLRLDDVLRMGVENNKRIASVQYLPAEAAATVEEELSNFDPVFEAGSAFGRRRPPVLGIFDEPQKLTSFNGDAGFGMNATAGGASQLGFSSIPGSSMLGLSKRNATGGATQLGFSVDSLQTNPSDDLQRFHPLWTSSLNIGVEQPLLQGAGVEFNRSLILIAQAGKQRADNDFETEVRQLVRDLERTYWDLYFAYKNLESQEIGMKLSLAIWDAEKTQLEARAATEADVSQARTQYESFRDGRLLALNQVLDAEANLRFLLGIPAHDARRLIPIEEPHRAEFIPDWSTSREQAYSLRPELKAQRLQVRSAELELKRQENGLYPDLTVFGNYSFLGADETAGQTLRALAREGRDNWTAGIRLRVPIGERAAHSAVRRAELVVARERAALRNLENDILFQLQRAYRAITTQYASLRIREARRQAARSFLESQIALFREGRTTMIVTLDAQTRYSDALRDEQLAVTQYNQALVDWEFANGSILATDRISIVNAAPAITGLRGDLSNRPEPAGIAVELSQGPSCPEEWPCIDPVACGYDPLYDPSVYSRYGGDAAMSPYPPPADSALDGPAVPPPAPSSPAMP